MTKKEEKKEENMLFFFFKQKTAYEIKECDWSSDVCSSDLGDKFDEKKYIKELVETGAI